MAFYELRQYKVLPGQMAGWVKIMEEEIIPFQVSKGMVITGSFQGETDPSIYVWLRRFESEEQRVALYAAVYEFRVLEDPDRAARAGVSGPVGDRCDADRADSEVDGSVVGRGGRRAARPDSRTLFDGVPKGDSNPLIAGHSPAKRQWQTLRKQRAADQATHPGPESVRSQARCQGWYEPREMALQQRARAGGRSKGRAEGRHRCQAAEATGLFRAFAGARPKTAWILA